MVTTYIRFVNGDGNANKRHLNLLGIRKNTNLTSKGNQKMTVKMISRQQIVNDILDKYGANPPKNLKKLLKELTK